MPISNNIRCFSEPKTVYVPPMSGSIFQMWSDPNVQKLKCLSSMSDWFHGSTIMHVVSNPLSPPDRTTSPPYPVGFENCWVLYLTIPFFLWLYKKMFNKSFALKNLNNYFSQDNCFFLHKNNSQELLHHSTIYLLPYMM